MQSTLLNIAFYATKFVKLIFNAKYEDSKSINPIPIWYCNYPPSFDKLVAFYGKILFILNVSDTLLNVGLLFNTYCIYNIMYNKKSFISKKIFCNII